MQTSTVTTAPPSAPTKLSESDLQGPRVRKDLRVPIATPFHVASLTAFDDHMKFLGYPRTLQQYEPTVRALLNYGHKVWLIPLLDPGSALEAISGPLKDAFSEGWEKDKDQTKRMKLIADALLVMIEYFRGA